MKNLLKSFFVLIAGIALLVRCGDDGNSVIDTENPGTKPKDVVVTPHSYLSEDEYDQLLIEFVYVDGYKPLDASIRQLRSFLSERLHKSKGIGVRLTAIPSPGKATYSLDDLRAIEETHRTQYPEDNKLAAWFFLADADYAGNKENSKVLGVAYGSSSMTIFEKTIHEFSGGLGEPSQHVLETTVIEHEFCHVMGLVNAGTGMVQNHEDTEHEHHCDNDNCLMYYAAETSNFLSNFIGSSVPDLDQNCIRDLQNNGGR
ncbi:zinc metalloprotease [Sunxiuqinia indica]|uniref:hypothetical protein n=1 Tax=Sunxiuqinia indica TaxID=2692584 RepID=UPI001357C893|nr:hypothetical protein [Sunxiuqinia indica]